MTIVDYPFHFSRSSTTMSSSADEVLRTIDAIGMALAPTVARLLAVVVPIAQAVQQVLERPDIQARIAAGVEALSEAHDRIAAVEAPGYTPYIEGLGHGGLAARLHVLMIRSCAERFHREDQDKRVALSALHDLARRRRWHPALARQVDHLRDNCWSASFLDRAFREAGGSELKDEFMDLLSGTCGGDYAGGPRLIAIAALIVPFAPSPRGRPLQFDTVLHLTFLRWTAEFGGRQAYTYGLLQDGSDAPMEDFTDEATAATRIELKRPCFNPTSARRAERRRVAEQPVDEGMVDGR